MSLNTPAEVFIGGFMDSHAVAEMLGVSIPTLREWERRGEGPPVVRISERVVRYPRAALESYLAGRMVREVAR